VLSSTSRASRASHEQQEPLEQCEPGSSACACLGISGCCFTLRICVSDVFRCVHDGLFVNRLIKQPAPSVSLVCAR
jgi:hypothetical protein